MPPRLGHKKSRLGCYSCKRRRVKVREAGWVVAFAPSPSPSQSIPLLRSLPARRVTRHSIRPRLARAGPNTSTIYYRLDLLFFEYG